MPIQFVPKQGMVLMCDFRGSVDPEMNKVRHVLVISPNRRRGHGLCTIVPFSTVAPNPVEKYHFRIPANKYTFFKKDTDVWAKADMISAVSLGRLDRVIDQGKHCTPYLQPLDFESIQLGALNSLGLAEQKAKITEVVALEEKILIRLDNQPAND